MRCALLSGLLIGAVTLAACGGPGDAGKARCYEWVEAYNALSCVDAQSALDVTERCPDFLFDNSAGAGCTWYDYYSTCIDTSRCDGDAPVADCSGECVDAPTFP